MMGDSNSDSTSSSASNDQSSTKIKQLFDQLQSLSIQNNSTTDLSSNSSSQSIHKFWKTQPVVQSLDQLQNQTVDGPLEEPKSIDQLRREPYKLPESFEWVKIDVENDIELSELYELLANNYVEDEDNSFRFAYPKHLLKWALRPPGWKKCYHVGVRVSTSKKLVAFISGVPATLLVKENTLSIVEINFLCVLRKLRSKRLAPVLIKEITRRCNLDGIFQAVYTAGKKLPGAVSSAAYWHRSINPTKLLDVGFSCAPRNMTLEKYIHRLRIPETLMLNTFRPMEEKDVPQVTKRLNEFLNRFSFRPVFSEEEVAYWLLPNTDIVYSYVVEDSNTITHFISFYRIPTKVLNHPIHSEIQVGYTYYYFYPTQSTSLKNQSELSSLFHDALVMAKRHQIDVLNTLEIMENKDMFTEFKFAKGDGTLHYYLYNWGTMPLSSDKLGLVLL